jgi:hypothetical protein
VRLFTAAWNDLGEHRNLAAVYVGVHVLMVCLSRGALAVVAPYVPEAHPPLWLPVFDMSRQLALAVAASVLQAVVFARLGKSLDRPLWKCRDDGEAVRRFFLLWFILNLGLGALEQLHANAIGWDIAELAMLLEILIFLAAVVLLPFGACVMYSGRLEWAALPEALRPMGRQLPLTLRVMSLLMLQYALTLLLQIALYNHVKDRSAILIPALTIAPAAFLECLAFCAMWRVCMIHRQSGDEDTGGFFDF